jgi:hypothetical protein
MQPPREPFAGPTSRGFLFGVKQWIEFSSIAARPILVLVLLRPGVLHLRKIIRRFKNEAHDPENARR